MSEILVSKNGTKFEKTLVHTVNDLPAEFNGKFLRYDPKDKGLYYIKNLKLSDEEKAQRKAKREEAKKQKYKSNKLHNDTIYSQINSISALIRTDKTKIKEFVKMGRFADCEAIQKAIVEKEQQILQLRNQLKPVVKKYL